MYLGIKKIAFFIGAALVSISFGYGQKAGEFCFTFDHQIIGKGINVSGNNVTIDYSIDMLVMNQVENDSGNFFRITIPEHIPTITPGEPELPLLNNLIVIPDGFTCRINISEVVSERINIPGFDGLIYPAQEGTTKNQQDGKPGFRIKRDLYDRDIFLGNDTVIIAEVGRSRGNNLATLSISPVKYNPSKNVLDVIVSMKIDIVFETELLQSGNSETETPTFRQLISETTLNYNENEVTPNYSEQPIKMIILTTGSYEKHLQTYINWKSQKGIETILISVGEEIRDYSYSALRDTIKNIYTYHQQLGAAPDYLLIVGDTDSIPYYEGAGNITDLYYGEMDGGTDYIPEIMIGRLPVKDSNDIRSVTEKIIKYEKYDFSEENGFASEALMFAGVDASYYNIMNGQIRYGVENYLSPATNINEHHFYFPVVNKDSLINIINTGASFINYTGHGEPTKLQSINFSVDDTASLNNIDSYPLFISNACQTSRFTTNSLGNIMVTAKEKGMIGFIGSSGDSYWNEDFYWAVGLGTPGAYPNYSTTGLGVLDRLFHTHEESPSDWYTSLGEIVYAGNMTVSSSNSSYKKNYWERYNLVGDPSLIPYIGTPDSILINVPDTIPNGINSISFQGEPFLYASLSMNDSILSASHIGSTGLVSFNLPEISDDSVLLVVTGQNRIPLIKKIFLGEISSEYLTLSASSFNDNDGNNNGIAEHGELINIDLTIDNLGSTGASGLYVKVISPSPWVDMINDSLYIGTFAGKSTLELNNHFSFSIADSIPDGYVVPFDVILKDTSDENHSGINIRIHAPSLSFTGCYLDDSEDGNNNFVADPGETFQLVFSINNSGSVDATGILDIETDNPLISVEEIGPVSIPSNSTVDIPVSFYQTEEIPLGSLITIDADYSSAPYVASNSIVVRIGGIMESFESADMDLYPWINNIQNPWTVVSSTPYNGKYAARSGDITHEQSSSLAIKGYYEQKDTLSFFYKVSSEDNYDFLILKLNDETVFDASGEIDWQSAEIEIPAGYNTIEWIYKKDQTVSKYEDCAMIDMIYLTQLEYMDFISKDLEVISIASPSQKTEWGVEEISVDLHNLGQDTIFGIDLAYRINQGVAVTQSFNDTIARGDTLRATFAQKADFSDIGYYGVEVFNTGEDDYKLNDTAKINIENYGYDLEIARIINPVQKEYLGRETVSVKLLNHGPESVENFTLYFKIDDEPAFSENFEIGMDPGDDSLLVTFLQKANLSLQGTYVITVFHNSTNDVNKDNDTLRVTIVNDDVNSILDPVYPPVEITLYPNPFEDYITLEIYSEKEESALIRLVGPTGRIIELYEKEILPGENQYIIGGALLAKGVYILMIDLRSGSISKKILKL